MNPVLTDNRANITFVDKKIGQHDRLKGFLAIEGLNDLNVII